MPCAIGRGAAASTVRRACLVFSPPREHTHTRKLAPSLLQSGSLYRPFSLAVSPSLDSLSSPAGAVPPPSGIQVLPPADPNWNLGLRLHITNPVNTGNKQLPPRILTQFLAVFSRKLLWEAKDYILLPFLLC